MNKKYLALASVFLILLIVFLISFAKADTYDATVTTDSGSYTVPVEVENGEVTHVYWPNGGAMSVCGAEIDDDYARGTNSRGDTVEVEVDGYEEGDYEE